MLRVLITILSTGCLTSWKPNQFLLVLGGLKSPILTQTCVTLNMIQTCVIFTGGIMSGITNANPAVVTTPNTYPDGSVVLLYRTTGMSQIAGMSFTISSSSSTGFTLLGLDASSFAQPATDVAVTFVPYPKPVQPQFFYITKIVRGVTTVVTVSMVHNYIPHQLARLSIPPSFGMQEGNGVTAELLSVTDYTMTLALDSQNFNAFSFPANVTNYIIPLFATLSPAGGRNEYDTLTIPFHSGVSA